MLSKTLDDGLKDYAIGTKVRALRKEKKLSLVRLGEHTGLSAALLSKIERGQIYPTLPTLLRIAMVFGVGLDRFFSEEPDKPTVAIVRKEDRLRMPAHTREDDPPYAFESLDFSAKNRKMFSYLVEFFDRESDPHAHEGAEIVYVVSGRVKIVIDGDDHELGEGDSIYFDSSVSHSYSSLIEPSSEAVIVVTA